MKVYTFFSPVVGKDPSCEWALIDLWKHSWICNGWDPVVLNEQGLLDAPEHQSCVKHFQALPSRNKKQLDLWCFLRWVAVAAQGGGFMSDYDVINYAFPPQPVGVLTVYDRWIPCVVSGGQEEFLKAIGWFLKKRYYWWQKLFKIRQYHCSDMTILKEHENEFKTEQVCVEYGLHGWQTAALVHYSNGSMRGQGLRAQRIPQLRSLP